jgi:hypothetical protein
MSNYLFSKSIASFVLKVFGAVSSVSFSLLLTRFLDPEATGFFFLD